jgi:sacsin
LSKGKIEEYTLLSIDIDTPPSVPIPGNIVPTKFHQYLDNGYGFINEYDYQFIALEIDDPGLNLHDYGNSQDDTEDKDIHFELTYKFVHIIKMDGPRHELPLFQEYEVNYGSEETAVVRAYKLFKFIRKSNITSGTDTDVILYKRNENHEEDESSLPSSLRDAYSEIRRILREAWQKEQDERTGIVKRLYRKWHPDKNPDNVQFCTKVFQYIQQCLARLEKGLELKDDDDDGQFNSQSSTGHSSSSGSYGDTWYDRYWFRFRRSENNTNSYSENNTNSSDRNSNTRGTFSNFDDSWSHRETYYEPYHWYNRANKWYKQAEYDLENAMVSLKQLDEPQFNWICYNAHQVGQLKLILQSYVLFLPAC